jgi:hypothetical protein
MKIPPYKRQRIIAVCVALIVFIGFIVWLVWGKTTKEEYVTSYSTFDYMYECSQPIKVHEATFPKGGEGPSKGKLPVNTEDSNKYCHVVGVY